MDPPRVSPPDTLIGWGLAHVLPLVPPNTCDRHVTKPIFSLPIPHVLPLPIILRQEHDPHLVFVIRERQVNLLRSASRPKPDSLGFSQQVGRTGQGIVVVIEAVRVDFGLKPAEDPEGVVGSKVDQGEGDGARPRTPIRGRRQEGVADESVVGRVRGRVNPEPVELRGGGDTGPLDEYRVAGSSEDGGGYRDGDGGWG